MCIILVTGELLPLVVGGNPRWWTLISSIVTQAVVIYSPDQFFVSRSLLVRLFNLYVRGLLCIMIY